MQSGVLESSQPFGLSLEETTLPQALRHASSVRDPNIMTGNYPNIMSRKSSIKSCGGVNSSWAGYNCDGGGIPGLDPTRGHNATANATRCCSLCAAEPRLGFRVGVRVRVRVRVRARVRARVRVSGGIIL